jgi:hypothetical protein
LGEKGVNLKSYLKLVIAGVFFSVLVSIGQATEPDEHLVKAREVVKEFGATLKKELKAALEAGGPENAIKVCAEKAIDVANKISRKTGWSIRRVSLKQRNPLNRPDEYEYSVLKKFEKQNEKEKSLEQYETLIIQGIKEIRYMKAIKIHPLCLKCHGKADEIAPATKEQLEANYPHDKATGYSVGQIRGAFSIRIPVE